jgi:polyhydroxyalkanoate synthesis regulator phasin
MKQISILLLLFFLLPISLSEPDPNFHIYLAFGQSNMEGQGEIEPQDIANVPERFKLLASVDMPTQGRIKGKWYTAIPPLCRGYTRIGVTDYFGRELAEKLPEEISIGLINVAIGGASIDLFDEEKVEEYIPTQPDWFQNIAKEYGEHPYKLLVQLGKLAQKDGVIKGILMHQGETNTGDEEWPYNVKKVYDNLIKDLDLNADEVPLLVGEVVEEAQHGCCYYHNQIIAKVPEVIPNSYVVKSTDVPTQDGAHFTTDGYRTMGRRYAQVMLDVLYKKDNSN